jgi:hypothetical protein
MQIAAFSLSGASCLPYLAQFPPCAYIILSCMTFSATRSNFECAEKAVSPLSSSTRALSTPPHLRHYHGHYCCHRLVAILSRDFVWRCSGELIFVSPWLPPRSADEMPELFFSLHISQKSEPCLVTRLMLAPPIQCLLSTCSLVRLQSYHTSVWG